MEQDRLYDLMALAEKQQDAVHSATAQLSIELAALARERLALAQAIIEMKQVGARSVSAVQKAAGDAVVACLTPALASAGEAAAQALGEATRPVLNRLAGVVQAAAATEGQLKRAGQWFAWKWVAVAAGGMAGACLLAWGSVAWERHQVDQLTEQKAALQSDVVDLQARVADLQKRGGRIRMNTCGKRLCIEASPNQGTGSAWTGPWNEDNGTPLVIPRGY